MHNGLDTAADRRVFDRRLFAAAAVLFPLIVLIGFGRTYYVKGAFDTPPLPSLLVHLHGIVMTLWVALFVVQTRLVAGRRIRLHQRLGYASIALAALIIVTGVPTALRMGKFGSQAAPPDIPTQLFLIVPLFDLVMFAGLFATALWYRRRPAEHKRLMLLTAVNFLPPAFARIPALQPLGPLAFFGIPALLALLVVGLDARRYGRVHRIFAGATFLLIASFVARLALMWTSAWKNLSGWLVGFV